MLIHSYALSLQEFPDEIALCLNVANCPCKCKGCSESYLQENKGLELNTYELDKIITKYINKGITLLGFLGGDNATEEIKDLSTYIRFKYKLKIGFYSGRDFLDISLVPYLDYYKYGRWIMPEGPMEEWHLKTCGPINFPNSNQKIFRVEEDKLIDITEKFRSTPIGNLSKFIIK